MEKIPADATPLVIGVFDTDQVRPRSREWKTLAAEPPVANQTSLVPLTVMLLPLAANAASSGSAAGMFSRGISFQVVPPSSVRITKKRPSTGSLKAMPAFEFQNANPSKNPFGSRFVNCTFQVFPPSVVL